VAIGMWEHSIDLLISGGPGVQPPEAVRFLQSKGIKIPKIDAKNINQ